MENEMIYADSKNHVILYTAKYKELFPTIQSCRENGQILDPKIEAVHKHQSSYTHMHDHHDFYQFRNSGIWFHFWYAEVNYI